uniref:Spermatogenesis-associated protein 2 PUB-like domain-containing protein n=1 Tax=Gasterosteus aculeatus aculeatus TaxID=481459 RepID=A0AAQ4P0C8_GASAC|nr:spermatogenesis-associated protein 2-like [Gasterosteus aculeatus aculeatus]
MSLMKDGTRSEEQPQVSRQQLYEDYVHFYQPRPEVAPCRDPSLLNTAARYLRGGPQPPGPFTVFPFHRAVAHHRARSGAYGRKHLCAFSRATQLLETICLNLFLQPWKKEIRTLKTFTGAFIYGLVPVLSSSTIQSVLASIGYVPRPDTPSEYRLREDADPDRAMLLAFELLLARVECDHLLEILEKDQLEPQEFMEVLQRRMGPSQLDEPTEKTGTGENEEENHEMEEVPLNLDSRLTVEAQPEPPGCPLVGVDESIMEMQKTYPDLAFRGRPLLPDKPQRTNSSRRDVPTTTSTNDPSGDSKGSERIKGTHSSTRSQDDSRADDDDACRGRGCTIRNSDGSREDGETQKHGGAQPTAETPACTLADIRRSANQKPPLSSTDAVQQKAELAESPLHVQDTKKEVERKLDNHGEEGHTREDTLGQPVTAGPEPGHAASRSSRSDPAEMEEQKQHLPLATGAAESFRGGDGAEQQESKDTGRDEEQLTKSFVMVELHKK